MNEKRYVYLAGKIKLGHAATQYRAQAAQELLKYGFHSLDPLRSKYMLPAWSQLTPNEVLMRDLQDIRRSTIVLAVMLKSESSSFGTPCEIMYAWERRIPVILITDEQSLVAHFWTRALCTNIFFMTHPDDFEKTLKEATKHIGYWYGSMSESEVYYKPAIIQEVTTQKSDTPKLQCPHNITMGFCALCAHTGRT